VTLIKRKFTLYILPLK